MLIPTAGLVLHTTHYSETSVIAKIFTEQLGVRSYILKGVRSATGRTKLNLLQPMSHLSLVVYNNPKTQLNHIKEIAPAGGRPLPTFDPAAASVRFFMAELLYRSLKEEEPLPKLFAYCVGALALCEGASPLPGGNAPTPLSSLPILFQLSLLRHLGLEPLDNYSSHTPYFNLKEGRYMPPPSRDAAATTDHADYLLDGSSSLHLHYYLDAVLHQQPVPLLTHRQRTQLIQTLLEYYRIHLPDFHTFKSHEILHEVLR